MTPEEPLRFTRHHARLGGQPPGLFGKLLAVVLGAASLVFVLMFSLIAVAAVAVGGLLLWGWLRWKTRGLRRQVGERPPAGGYVIDGEAVRERDTPAGALPDR